MILATNRPLGEVMSWLPKVGNDYNVRVVYQPTLSKHKIFDGKVEAQVYADSNWVNYIWNELRKIGLTPKQSSSSLQVGDIVILFGSETHVAIMELKSIRDTIRNSGDF